MQPKNVVEVDRDGCIAPQGTELCTMSQSAPAARQDPVVSQSAPAASQSREFVPGGQWLGKTDKNNWCLLPTKVLPAPGLFAQDFQVDRPSLAQGAALAADPDAAAGQKNMAAALLLADGTVAQPNQGASRQKLRVNGQCDSWSLIERSNNSGREWWSVSYQNGGDW